MAKIVIMREVWTQMMLVEEDVTDDEAIEIVREGGGLFMDDTAEFSHTMNFDTWTVEDA